MKPNDVVELDISGADGTEPPPSLGTAIVVDPPPPPSWLAPDAYFSFPGAVTANLLDVPPTASSVAGAGVKMFFRDAQTLTAIGGKNYYVMNGTQEFDTMQMYDIALAYLQPVAFGYVAVVDAAFTGLRFLSDLLVRRNDGNFAQLHGGQQRFDDPPYRFCESSTSVGGDRTINSDRALLVFKLVPDAPVGPNTNIRRYMSVAGAPFVEVAPVVLGFVPNLIFADNLHFGAKLPDPELNAYNSFTIAKLGEIAYWTNTLPGDADVAAMQTAVIDGVALRS